jgi:hypothetical protein
MLLVARGRLILAAITFGAAVGGKLKDKIDHLTLEGCGFISIALANRGRDRGPTPFRTLLLFDNKGQRIHVSALKAS